jgi:para-nitrobenzyl esterase
MSRRRFLVNSSLAAAALAGGFTRKAWALPGPASPVTVTTADGVLRGESADGVRVFRGVPFAEPPVGPLRFLPPVKAKSWTGVRDATVFSAAPMQPGQKDVTHSEDCLYLNLWAPDETQRKLPVFVWIHGGGFTGGHAFEAMYDGSGFAREGIVCITVAYRLGVFGFLDYEPLLGPEYAGTANNALRDLMLALEWIRDNVAAFGGDPERVTVGGQSAGAKLTDILMGTPSAQPLFHQMISESGGAERIWPKLNSTAIAKGFGEAWTKQAGNTIAGLKTADGSLLIDAQQELIAGWPQHFPLRAELDGKLIPRLPVETIAQGSTRGKRLLLGTNREESAYFIGPHPAKDAVASDLGNMGVAKFDEVYKRYAEVYPQLSVEERRIRAVTAEEYWVPSMRVAEAHVRGGGTAFVYELDFAETSGKLQGYAYHSEEVGMVWGHPHKLVDNAVAEAALGEQMHAAWAAFIRGETPEAAWKPFEVKSRRTMIFDEKQDGAKPEDASKLELNPQGAELQLWDGVL